LNRLKQPGRLLALYKLMKTHYGTVQWFDGEKGMIKGTDDNFYYFHKTCINKTSDECKPGASTAFTIIDETFEPMVNYMFTYNKGE
jgi:hypothetical protein